MKLKYLVLGALCLVLGASSAWAEALPTGSVIGYWKFNADAPGLDSSGNGNDMKATSTFSDASYSSGASYDGKGGYLLISKQNGKAYAGLNKGGFDSSTKATGFSIVAKFKADSKWSPSTTFIFQDDIKTMLGYIKDHNWHTICWVLDPSLDTKSYRLNVEPEFDDDNGSTDTKRAETCSDKDTPGHPTMKFPITLTADDATFGGYVYSSSYGFYGAFDDVCILDRRLTKREMTRYRHTAEVYVYSRPNSNPSFTAATGWSSDLAPSSIPGADFIVENGRTITQGSTATFAARSLTLGRAVDLVSMVDSGKMIATKVGNLTSSGTGTMLTIADLRLNCGTLTGADGNSLTATKLTVGAMSATPYKVNVDSGTYAISGVATGGGWIEKTGAGVLDLSGLKGDYRVKVTAGNVIYPDDYDYGTKPVLLWQ